uniref:Odorant binding protein 5 n=1 Tax=Chrysoperla nipponensis TaxID=413239 RepID=A0A0R8P224_CHRNP|nr:odorant binding protein 5 [Chrysoperla nipponensis]
MKYFIALCVIAALCIVQNEAKKLSADQQKQLKEKSEECKKETKVDPQLIENAKKGEPVSGDDFKAYAVCLTKRLGLLNDAGDVNIEKALAFLPPGEDKVAAKKSLDSCQNIKVDEAINTKFLRSLCIYKEFKGIL